MIVLPKRLHLNTWMMGHVEWKDAVLRVFGVALKPKPTEKLENGKTLKKGSMFYLKLFYDSA